MKKLIGSLSLGICVLIAGYILSTYSVDPNIKGSATYEMPTSPFMHQDLFYDEILFYKGIESVRPSDQNKAPIVGGVIPHHLLASFMIADFYARLIIQQPETIILIGPNHYERGKYLVLTSDGSWSTPQGTVSANMQLVGDLTKSNLAEIDHEVLTLEHSVSDHMAFIAHYLPQTRVVPLILSGYLKLEDIEKLVAFLSPVISAKTVVAISVDFSHYLSEQEAQTNDQVTWQAMQNHDYDRLMHMNNDYMDSPASVVALLKLMQKLEKQPVLISNTNSGVILKDPTTQTTSYFEILFH